MLFCFHMRRNRSLRVSSEKAYASLGGRKMSQNSAAPIPFPTSNVELLSFLLKKRVNKVVPPEITTVVYIFK